MLFNAFRKKITYKSLVGKKVLLFIKDINTIYTVNVLGCSKYLIRVEHYDGKVRKYDKGNVILLPNDKDYYDAISESIDSIKLETGVLQQLIDKRSYEFK